MKLSRYTLFYDNYPNNDEGLLFNTRTQAVHAIDREMKDFIERITFLPVTLSEAKGLVTSGNGDSSSRHGVGTQNDKMSAEQQEAIRALKEDGIIVDDNVDESRVLENWFNRIKYQAKSLHATILTTYKCNFACVYCFEERVKHPKSLDEAESKQIIEWLKHQVVKNNINSLNLMFYGGEPLMNTKAIFDIAGALYPWSKENHIKFSFAITTNGSLVKADLMEELSKIGLRSIRVTLDGDKEHHDKRRPFLDGRGTFESIIANINQMTDKIKIEIGANFDKENIYNLYKLLDYLDEQGLNKRISNVIFSPVIARLGEQKNPPTPLLFPPETPARPSGGDPPSAERGETSDSTPPLLRGAGGISENAGFIPVEMVGCHTLAGELADEAVKLRKEVIKRGYNVNRAAIIAACPMEQDHSMVVIDPYGDIYKCAGFVGRREFSVGNVSSNEFNYRNAEFMTMNLWKQCLNCIYVPMCGGGCRLMAQLKHSDCSKPFCDMEYYQKTFPELLKMDYERGAL